MDPTVAAEARERVKKWIEETRQLLSLMPELVEPDSATGERVAAAEREVEKLKREIDELKKENIQLRGEKDEIAQSLSQIAAKLGLGPRKSPFERTPHADPPKPGEAPRAADPRPGDHPKA